MKLEQFSGEYGMTFQINPEEVSSIQSTNDQRMTLIKMKNGDYFKVYGDVETVKRQLTKGGQ
jgi:uncharacterized protein YlzI (FlbEa/FlbD family)